MVQIAEDEIDRGLVLHLDPSTLKNAGATICCCDESREVKGTHFFLCLGVDATHGDWLPLYSEDGVGRLRITKAGKYGHPKWTRSDSFYHPNQIWTVTHGGVVEAAIGGSDLSMPGQRNGVLEDAIPNI